MAIFIRVIPATFPIKTVLQAPGADEEVDPAKAPTYVLVSSIGRVQEDPVHGFLLGVGSDVKYAVPGFEDLGAFQTALGGLADAGFQFVRGENNTFVADTPPLLSR